MSSQYKKTLKLNNQLHEYTSFAFCTKEITPNLHDKLKSEALIFNVGDYRIIITVSFTGLIDNLMEYVILNGELNMDMLNNHLSNLLTTIVSLENEEIHITAYLVDENDFPFEEELMYIDVTCVNWLELYKKDDINYALFVTCNLLIGDKKATLNLRSRELPNKLDFLYGTLNLSSYDIMMSIGEKLHKFNKPAEMQTFKLWDNLMIEPYKSDFKRMYEVEIALKETHYEYE